MALLGCGGGATQCSSQLINSFLYIVCFWVDFFVYLFVWLFVCLFVKPVDQLLCLHCLFVCLFFCCLFFCLFVYIFINGIAPMWGHCHSMLKPFDHQLLILLCNRLQWFSTWYRSLFWCAFIPCFYCFLAQSRMCLIPSALYCRGLALSCGLHYEGGNPSLMTARS